MILTALLLIQVCLTAGLMLFVWYSLKRARNELRRAIDSFVTSPDEKTPSQLAQYADLISQVFAARLMTSVQAVLRGAAGGAAGAENRAALEEATGQSPILAAAQVFAPNLVKKLGKNPAALMALTALGNRLGGAAASAPGPEAGNNGHKPRFNLS